MRRRVPRGIKPDDVCSDDIDEYRPERSPYDSRHGRQIVQHLKDSLFDVLIVPHFFRQRVEAVRVLDEVAADNHPGRALALSDPVLADQRCGRLRRCVLDPLATQVRPVAGLLNDRNGARG